MESILNGMNSFKSNYFKAFLYVSEKIPLGRPRRRWVDNIRMDLQEVGCGYMDWTGLTQDRDRWRKLVSAVMNLRVPWNAGNFLTSCKPVSFSRRTLHGGVSEYSTALIVNDNFHILSSFHVNEMGSHWLLFYCILPLFLVGLKMAGHGRNT